MKCSTHCNSILRGPIITGLIILIGLASIEIKAQGLPSTIRGDYGLQSGSQAPPGLYITTAGVYYRPDEIRTSQGGTIRVVTLNQGIIIQDFFYVTGRKFLGATYGVRAAFPFANAVIETPFTEQRTGWGFSDVYVEPVNLGWHSKRFDASIIYGFVAPTGQFTPGASDNTGLGQWENDFSGGFTLYSDEKRRFHIATLATYSIHSSKRDSEFKVGDTLTLEGGVGMTVGEGRTTMGLAYYTQWKMTKDENLNLPPFLNGKHRYIGLGPEFNHTFIVGKKYPFALTVRYFFETGNRVATQGNNMFLAISYVIPKR